MIYKEKHMGRCKWCNLEFDMTDKPSGWMANHSRWCSKNPKAEEHKKLLSDRTSSMNTKRKGSKGTNQFIKAKAEGVHIPHAMKGKKGKSTKHTQETKDRLRLIALGSTHRRLKRNTINYKGILLDSMWEYHLAVRLDELNISWNRPGPIKWKDNQGIEHNYFPDFYLPDYDLYLDPKNPGAYKVQKEKINILLKTYKNLIFLTDENSCKTFSLFEYIN